MAQGETAEVALGRARHRIGSEHGERRAAVLPPVISRGKFPRPEPNCRPGWSGGWRSGPGREAQPEETGRPSIPPARHPTRATAATTNPTTIAAESAPRQRDRQCAGWLPHHRDGARRPRPRVSLNHADVALQSARPSSRPALAKICRDSGHRRWRVEVDGWEQIRTRRQELARPYEGGHHRLEIVARDGYPVSLRVTIGYPWRRRVRGRTTRRQGCRGIGGRR